MSNTNAIDSIRQQASICTDDKLLAQVQQLAAKRRRIVAELLVCLAEIDARKLYARFATSSMFAFCVDKLGLSEPSAYRYIAAARLARSYPRALTMLQQGKLHLSGLALLSKHICAQNSDRLLSLAAGKTKRKLEQQLAERFPQPAVPSSIRKLPQNRFPATGTEPYVEPESVPSEASSLPASGPQPAQPSAEPEPEGSRTTPQPSNPLPSTNQPSRARAVVQPLAAQRYRVQFTASAEFVDKLKQAKALLGHQGNPDVADVLELALDQLIAQRMKKKFALTNQARRRSANRASKARAEDRRRSTEGGDKDPETQTPTNTNGQRPKRSASKRRNRTIPAEVKRAVLKRDGMRCTYVDELGQRCGATAQLEFHHQKPFALGGENTVNDLTLRCRAHNQFQARRDFGPNHIERAVASRRAKSGPARRFTFPGDNRAPSSLPEQRDTVPGGHVASP